MSSKLKSSIRRTLVLASLLTGTLAMAQGASHPGITATEIRIGQTLPYSGPVSAYGTIGRASAAYFAKLNAEGGINGRKINLLSLDDAYSPPKTLEQTRKLVEQDGVAFILATLGTGPNRAIVKYLNGKKVPQLFVQVSGTGFAEPKTQPWTLGYAPTIDVEARIIARHILKTKPAGKVGVLYQNDDFGKGFVEAFTHALGDKAKAMLAAEASYEVTDTTVDSQIISLKAAGADHLIIVSTPKFATQAIRKVADLNWHPQTFLSNGTSSISQVLKPAGLENSVGTMTTHFFKDPTDPKWADDPAMRSFRETMTKYYPEGDQQDSNNIRGFMTAEAAAQVLRQAGNDLSRENIMKQATNIKGLKLGLTLPGIEMNTSPTNYRPITQMQMMRFDGTRWLLLGDVINDN